MTDIIKRLNEIDDENARLSTIDLIGEAANEIERLRKEIERLKERNSELGWIVSPDRMGQ